jgi:hypothetical protein
MWRTSTGHDRIKGSCNSFQNRMVDLFYQIMMVAKSSPSRSWADYTTTTEEEHEVWKTRLEIAGRSIYQSSLGFVRIILRFCGT